VTPHPQPIALGPGVAYLQHKIPKVVETLVALPLSSEGGPSDLNVDRKLLELGWMIVALRNLSWTWPTFGRCLETLEGEVARLETLKASSFNGFGLQSVPDSADVPLPGNYDAAVAGDETSWLAVALGAPPANELGSVTDLSQWLDANFAT
jgi:hypothetical protein